MLVKCSYCGSEVEKRAAHINRATKNGSPMFCNKTCFGLSRRSSLSEIEKKARKRVYDMEYRQENLAALKVKKAEYYQRTKDPEKEAIARKKRMHKHVEYCRRPEYVKWKKKYDREHRSKKNYGEFWESAVATLEIREECLSRMTDNEIRVSKGTSAKAQKRRKNEQINSEKLERVPLGNIDFNQGRKN